MAIDQPNVASCSCPGFIDCSGDSILAPLTRADVRWGREARSDFDESIEPEVAGRKTMRNTLLIQLRRTDEPQPFTPPAWASRITSREDLPRRLNGVLAHNFWGSSLAVCVMRLRMPRRFVTTSCAWHTGSVTTLAGSATHSLVVPEPSHCFFSLRLVHSPSSSMTMLGFAGNEVSYRSRLVPKGGMKLQDVMALGPCSRF